MDHDPARTETVDRHVISMVVPAPWSLAILLAALVVFFAGFLLVTHLGGDFADAVMWGLVSGALVYSVMHLVWTRDMPAANAVGEVQMDDHALFVMGLRGVAWTRIPLAAVLGVEVHESPVSMRACLRVHWRNLRGRRSSFDFHPIGTGSRRDADAARARVLGAVQACRVRMGDPIHPVAGSMAADAMGPDPIMTGAPVGDADDVGTIAADAPARNAPTREGLVSDGFSGVGVSVGDRSVAGAQTPAVSGAAVDASEDVRIRLSVSRRRERLWEPIQFAWVGALFGPIIGIANGDALIGLGGGRDPGLDRVSALSPGFHQHGARCVPRRGCAGVRPRRKSPAYSAGRDPRSMAQRISLRLQPLCGALSDNREDPCRTVFRTGIVH